MLGGLDMKEIYTKPVVEVELFTAVEILTVSYQPDIPGTEESKDRI